MRKSAIVLLLGALSLSACAKSEAAPNEGSQNMPKMGVDVVTLREEPLRDSEEYLAQLVSRHQVAVYSQVVGNVSAIYVKPGDTVSLGAPLLQIDPRRENANLDNLVAAREQKKATLALARTTAARSERLLNAGLGSQAQFDQDRSAKDVAEQDLKAQEAAISAQGAQLAFYKITAPFPGKVGDIPVKLGDLVSPTLKLTSVDDNANLEVYVNVPVEKLGDVSDKSSIQVLENGVSVAEAPVSFVSPEANPVVQAVLVKAVVPNAGTLRAAQLVRARVIFKTHPGVRVSVSAITRQSGQYFVFVVESAPGGAVARQRAVMLGDLSDNLYDVEKGLNPGDRVIVSQLQKLKDGAAIDPKEAVADAGSAQPVQPAH